MKIGIILDSTKVSWYIYDLVKWIKQNPNFSLEILLIQNIEIKRQPVFNGNLINILDRFFFKIINIVEKKLVQIKYSQYLKHLKKYDLKKLKVKEIDVELDKLDDNKSYLYKEDTINKIKELNLDIILRGGSGILKGEILKSSKFGIISFHHGDNLSYRGKPSGFWEVKEKNLKSGFTIQILNEKLDDGNVLKRGNFRTQNFYHLNDILLKERSNQYMKFILSNINKTKKLPTILSSFPYNKKIYKSPKYYQSINYLLSRIYEKFQGLIYKFFFNDVWHVGFQMSALDNINLQNSAILKNPKNCFLADPFIVEEKNENFIFVEEYSFKHKKGIISVYKVSKEKSERIGVAIEEDFHLSFPFIFKYKNNYFMVPETKAKGEIRLYECEDFPLKWKFKKTIFNSINATDTMIFEHNGIWWMLSTFSNCGRFNDSELHVFYSEEGPITQNWKGLSQNPVIIDPEFGRNGGIYFDKNKIFRVAQSFGFNAYGKKISIREIVELDQDNYSEIELKSIQPDFMKNLIGIHHFHSNNKYMVHDFCKREFKL